MKRTLSLIIIFMAVMVSGYAQPARQYVTVVVSPDHADWVYKPGEEAHFTLYAIKDNVKLQGVTLQYEYGPEKLPAVFKGSVKTGKNGEATIKVPGAKAPGFVTVKASVELPCGNYSGYTTIGFDPYSIKPTTTLPDDFRSYWDDVLKKASEVPMDIRMTFSPEKSNDKADVYYVRVQSYRRGNYVYGVLTIPKGEGPFPAVLRLPGASVRGFSGPNPLAYEGMIVFEIGIHGIPVDQSPEIYSALQSGSLAGYAAMGLDNRDTFYYKKVYVGCVRAVDFLFTLDKFDKERLAVYGGSQGGMLSIVTASLDNRVKYMVCHYPAFCDVTGYYNGRAGLQRDKRPETAGTGARCRPLAVPMACQRRSQMAEDTVRNGLTGIYKQKNPPRMERIFLFVIVCPKKRA